MVDERERNEWVTGESHTEVEKPEDDEKITLTKGRLHRLLENAKASVTDDAIAKDLDRLHKMDEEHAMTEIDPAYRATMTIGRYEPHSLRERFHIRHNLEKALEPISRGDLTGIKRMLAAQAFSQDAIANSLLQRNNVFGNDIKKLEPWVRLGLKALSQSRAAAEALNEIVNPSQVAFVKQQNIASQQQVNNGASPQKVGKRRAKDITPTRVRGKTKTSGPGSRQISSNKVLKKGNYEQRLDLRAKSSTGRVNTRVEALGTINRSQNERGQGKVEPECL